MRITLSKPSARDVFLAALIAALCASAAIAIAIFLIGKFDDTQEKLLITTLIIAGYSLTSLCCSALFDRKKYEIVAASGFLIAALGLFTSLQVIWGVNLYGYHAQEQLVRTAATCAVLSFCAAHISLLLLVKPESKFMKGLLFLTVAFIVVVACMLTDIVMGRVYSHHDPFYRTLGVFAVLDVLGTILIPIVRRVKSLK